MKRGDKIEVTVRVSYYSKKKFKIRYRYRIDPVPFTGHYKHKHCGKSPVIKFQLKECILMKELGFKVRCRRNQHYIQNYWFDKDRYGRYNRGTGWKRTKIKRQWMK